jgi:hypothetical protein
MTKLLSYDIYTYKFFIYIIKRSNLKHCNIKYSNKAWKNIWTSEKKNVKAFLKEKTQECFLTPYIEIMKDTFQY